MCASSWMKARQCELLIEELSHNRDHPLKRLCGQTPGGISTTGDSAPGSATIQQKLDDHDKPALMLIEPLSERELEVLRLLRSELSGPEIAQQLIVSLNTLRTHTKNIFNKLGVNNRRAAVRRAEELDLF